jgi:hypothetical protein
VSQIRDDALYKTHAWPSRPSYLEDVPRSMAFRQRNGQA